MKTIVKETLTALLATLLFAIVLCGVYPLMIWGAGQLMFPDQANGSLIEGKDRKIVGSEMLGQNFSGPKYFHPRPSAAGANGYDAASSSGSNLGPTSQKLIDAVKGRVKSYRAENGLPADALVPGDAVTASASGLDPHISLKNAEWQVPRVARERNLPVEVVKKEVLQATDGRFLGVLGEPGVNVLKLNLRLDSLATPAGQTQRKNNDMRHPLARDIFQEELGPLVKNMIPASVPRLGDLTISFSSNGRPARTG